MLAFWSCYQASYYLFCLLTSAYFYFYYNIFSCFYLFLLLFSVAQAFYNKAFLPSQQL